MNKKKRARGRAYDCVCGEEKLRLTRAGVQARVDRWGYLFGECGGGVKLRFDGAKVVEVRPVDEKEAGRVRSLPAPKREPFDRMLEAIDDRARRRLDEIVVEVRDALQESMSKWMVIGERLAEAKKLLKHGDFGLWVERNGMDRVNAFKFIKVWEMVHALPGGFQKLFLKIGQEKSVLLERLPQAKRLEILEHGVPVSGTSTPIDRVTYRQLNVFVRSVVGKSNRGRKPKDTGAGKPSERWGLPAECVDVFQSALKSLQALKRFAKEGWTDKQRPGARKLWQSVNHLFWQLQDDLKMGELLKDQA